MPYQLKMHPVTTPSSTDVLHITEALYFLPSSGLVGPKNRIGVRKHDVRITVMTFYLTQWKYLTKTVNGSTFDKYTCALLLFRRYCRLDYYGFDVKKHDGCITDTPFYTTHMCLYLFSLFFFTTSIIL